jgi:hypothetical protein
MAFPGKKRMAGRAIYFLYAFVKLCCVRIELDCTDIIPGTWDMPELTSRRDKIVKGDKLKLRMVL